MFICSSSSSIYHQRAALHKQRAALNCPSEDKELEKLAAWADLFTHKHPEADQSGSQRALRGSRAAIFLYRCGPAALMMWAAGGGALPPNRLIFSQRTHIDFDAVCFLPSLPVVADHPGCCSLKAAQLHCALRMCSHHALVNICWIVCTNTHITTPNSKN